MKTNKNYDWWKLYIYRKEFLILEIEKIGCYYYVFQYENCKIADGFEKILDLEGLKELIRRLKRSGYYFNYDYRT